MNWIELLGYAASGSVLLTFCMSTMLPLRIIAIGSNVLFASYGALAHIYPVLVLHAVLLPVNVIRLVQILRVLKGVRAVGAADLPITGLLPLMSRRDVKAGEVLLNKGEKADRLYYLYSGTVKIPEIDKTIEAGATFGEIGIFGRQQKRTATIVCVSDCEIYEMSESQAKQLYYQNPIFGFAVIQLVIERLLDEINLLQATTEPPQDSRAREKQL